MSSPSDYSDDIRQGVYDGMPDWGMILDSIHEGISQQPVPLPPGSHLELEEGERGVDVVALRNVPSAPDRAEVLTERGYWVRLNDKQCLAIDHKPRTEVPPRGCR